MPNIPSKSHDLADENKKFSRNGSDSKQEYSNAICLYRRISMVPILLKILNLPVVAKGFNWKDPPS